MNPAGIFIIAHEPLATALRSCAMHVYKECSSSVAAYDVQANMSPEESTSAARIIMETLGCDRVLVLTDLFNSTPAKVAERLVDGKNSRLVVGVNFPMLLRTIPLSEREKTLDILVERAVEGAKNGIQSVNASPPQNQIRQPVLSQNDQQHRHQQ